MFGGEGMANSHEGDDHPSAGRRPGESRSFAVRPGGARGWGGGGDSRRVRGSGTPGRPSKRESPPRQRGGPGTEFCVDIVVKGRKTEVPERFRKHVAEKLNEDPEARRQGDQPRRRGVQGAQPAAGGPFRPGGDHAPHPGPGDPGGGGGRRPVRRARPGRGQAGGAAAQGSTTSATTRRGNGRLPAAEVADAVPGARVH